MIQVEMLKKKNRSMLIFQHEVQKSVVLILHPEFYQTVPPCYDTSTSMFQHSLKIKTAKSQKPYTNQLVNFNIKSKNLLIFHLEFYQTVLPP